MWDDCHGHYPFAKMGTGLGINSMASQRGGSRSPHSLDCPLPSALARDLEEGYRVLCPVSQKHSEVVVWEVRVSLGASLTSSTFN